ncbi:MAG: MipA/OmpV family protein [Acidobacteria bacterium]|nr:MipA/OmpV family protein [Acidobacteriota bacterium]
MKKALIDVPTLRVPGTAAAQPRSTNIHVRVCLFVLTMLVSFPVAAQEQATEQDLTTTPSAVQWSLGLAAISSPRPYVGASNTVTPIPIVELYYKKLYIQGVQAGYHLVDTKNIAFDVRARLVFAGLDPDSSPFLEGMTERESSIEGGLVFDWKPGNYKLSASGYTDLLGRSDGQQAGLDFSRTWTFERSRWGLTPSIGVVWQSSNFVDYYVGVRPEEARPDRLAFRGRSAINFRSSILGYYFLTMRIRLVGQLQVQRLDNEIFESPIVDERRSVNGFLGVTYRFGKLPPRPS